jgi:M6 family metalloprotease-like protein
MRRTFAFVALFTIVGLIAPSHVYAAAKAGANCAKVGKTEIASGKKFTCIKSGKKLVWNKGVQTTKPIAAVVNPRDNANRYTVTARDLFSDVEVCKIKSTLSGSESIGFPRSPTAIPSIGVARGVTLFVEFTDLKDDGNPIRVWKTQQVPTAEKFYKTASYGKLDFKVDLIEKIYLINKSVLTYNLDTHHDAPAKPNANPFGLVVDAMTVADPDVDFSKYDFVNVVTPATTMIGFEGAVGLYRQTFDGKSIEKATFGPIREYADSPTKYNWLIHESGHLMNLLHPYNSQGNLYKEFVIPTWDLMGDSLTPNPEFLAWHKHLLGWLAPNQVNCMNASSKSNSTHLITPLTENAEGVKATFIKLSETQVLVIENRRKSSLNSIDTNQEGVLVYLVDGTINPGLGAVTIIYSELTRTSDDRLVGTLKPGDAINHKNITVKVLSSAVSGDYVSVELG